MNAPFWLFFTMISTVLAFVFSWTWGGLNVWIAACSLLLGVLLGRRLAGNFGDFAPEAPNKIDIILIALVVYASFRHFMWMIYPADHGLSTLSANNFGDLPMHINYIRGLSQGIDFPPMNAIYAAEPLRYPYGMDLFNSLLEKIGIPLSGHLLLTGVIATLASLALLKKFGGGWAMGGFFFNSGLVAWSALMHGAALTPQETTEWKSLFLAVFITQRGMLLALPVGLLLLLGTLREYSSAGTKLTPTQKTALGLAWGFLPLFHLHSFVAVSLCMALYAAREMGLRGVKQLLTSPMALIAYLPATLALWHSTDGFRKASVAHIQWGWTAKEGELLSFLVNNFGVWLLLPLAIAFAIYKSREYSAVERRALWVEFLGATALFVLFFNLMLAPWPWDNIKVLIWPYLLYLRLAYVVLDQKLGQVWAGGLKALVFAVLFLPGVMIVYGSLASPERTGVRVYQDADLAATQEALKDTGINAVFASGTSHQHALTFWGRFRVHGYDGHVWSHGIHGQETMNGLQAIMKGEEHWLDVAKRLGVTHIFWGPSERAQYGDCERPWMKTLVNISRVPEYGVYEVR